MLSDAVSPFSARSLEVLVDAAVDTASTCLESAAIFSSCSLMMDS